MNSKMASVNSPVKRQRLVKSIKTIQSYAVYRRLTLDPAQVDWEQKDRKCYSMLIVTKKDQEGLY